MPETLHGVSVHFVPADGPVLDSERAATDLIGSLWGTDVEMVVVPAQCVGDDFFRLRTGVAGAIAQKFVNYRKQLVIIGDISRHVEASTALRDFVFESNRRKDLWFLADEAELHARLRNA
ncbi:hypothetical protein Lesp02_04410 [Lentzea sp. NBRC 105346]|uniref:DUF4180 domain-containing protein n=1 Tax=Lentzea sp. NBRC 105346 TaxID=3032205 RepID=UPI0024A58B00|nr:DUF4180 domain-containing protein [Lentzea sp. NBRC 105346]GLZ28251.1 hypothetical protein Lesp02_04410 [Lentzea sp. NBRC 105346]